MLVDQEKADAIRAAVKVYHDDDPTFAKQLQDVVDLVLNAVGRQMPPEKGLYTNTDLIPGSRWIRTIDNTEWILADFGVYAQDNWGFVCLSQA